MSFKSPSILNKLFHVIGDTHGHADLLIKMLEMIRNDSENKLANRRVLIFPGDYVDRAQSTFRNPIIQTTD
ncbi:MAG: metallophosphoesterase [Gammaproteobacteria bacterium]|nr:metallophosphoesterase [Gammaproteobacteria bacterium]MCY4275104.1 metallophosphoesterase [Gammaproteobacteria bacterium]